MKDFLQWLNAPNGDLAEIAEYLNFSPAVNEEDQQNLLDNGWWHVLPIATQSSAILALQMLPDKVWTKWPVVRIFDYNRAINFAPHLGLLPAFSVFQSAYTDANLRSIVLEDWGEEMKLADQLPEVFGGSAPLHQVRDILQEIEQNSEGSSDNDEYYRYFWQKMYPRDAVAHMHAEIEAMRKEETYIPAAQLESDPITNLRWPHLIGSRAYAQFYAAQQQELFHHLWKSYTAYPGYNAESTLFNHRPSESSDSDIQDFSIAEILKVELPQTGFEDLRDSAWHPSIEAMVAKGRRQYTGEEHLQAASQLLQDHTSESEFWPALVGAAYWSGMNGGKVKWQAYDRAMSYAQENEKNELRLALQRHQSFRP